MAVLTLEDKPRTRWPASFKVGSAMFGLVVVTALCAPWFAPYPYDLMDAEAVRQAPSAQHWFGTDEYGRDVLSRVLIGAQLSLFMAIFAATVSVVLGVPLGLIAGYYRGFADAAIMRAVDLFISIPPILLGLLLLAVTQPNIWKTALAVGIVYVPIMVRLTRGIALEVTSEEYVVAARARGESDAYIIVSEILPNAWPPIIVEAALRMTFALLLGSALSFLGLGIQPPSSDWGLMVAEARPFVDSAPWIALAPGLAICVTVIAANLMGDGLREILDPKLKQR